MGRRRREGDAWRSWLGGWFLLLLAMQTACARGVPRDGSWTGARDRALVPPVASRQGVTLKLGGDFAPLGVTDAQVREALTRFLLEQPLRVDTRQVRAWEGHVVRASWGRGNQPSGSVEEGYARLCEERGAPGDCFHLLGEGGPDARLSERGRFMLGLSLALAPGLEAALGELRVVSAQAMTSLLLGLSLYLVVLMAPEPLSKGLALMMTLWLWSYVGSELWGVITATRLLWMEAKGAPTFGGLREASERYARVLGPNTMRLLLLLATWKAGAAGQDGMKGVGLPRFGQTQAWGPGGFGLAEAASQAESLSVAEGRLTLTLPAGAGAVWAMQEQGEQKGHIHHIATVKNDKSTHRGGPWTPKLKRFFDKAGLSMEDEANKVVVPGHKGPHPQAYHEQVFERLEGAVKGCETTAQCREALTQQLKKLAVELREVGSELNNLVTGAEQG